MAEKKLSKKALNKSFRNWFYGHLTCFSQEHMQTFGYLCAMLPLVEELYDTREEQTEALKTYSAFFNTEPQLGTVIVGMTAGLEEAKANGEDIDGEMINGIRAGLMGPVAGIGDSLLVGTLIPILLGVALGMSSGGSPLGAIFYIIAYNVILTLGMRLLYFKGYELGGKAVEMIVGEKANAIRESIIMLGTVVIGAVAASWISITTPLVLPGDISLQKDVLDTIFPKMLPLGTVMLCYWLMSKKKMAPTTVMLVLVGIALMLLGLDAHASAIFWMGAGLLVLGNLAARICCELVMMFIILCRKTVSVDRRLSKIEGAFTAETETEDGVDDAAAMYDEPAVAAWRSEAETKAETETASAYGAAPQEADAESAQTAQAGRETTEPVAEADEAAETATDNLDENAKSANPQELQ